MILFRTSLNAETPVAQTRAADVFVAVINRVPDLIGAKCKPVNDAVNQGIYDVKEHMQLQEEELTKKLQNRAPVDEDLPGHVQMWFAKLQPQPAFHHQQPEAFTAYIRGLGGQVKKCTMPG